MPSIISSCVTSYNATCALMYCHMPPIISPHVAIIIYIYSPISRVYEDNDNENSLFRHKITVNNLEVNNKGTEKHVPRRSHWGRCFSRYHGAT